MRPEMCLCCNDVNRFNSLLWQVENILRRLERIEKGTDVQKNNEYWRLFHQFSSDSQHPHFMCGTCFKADTSKLKRIEDKIDECLTNLIMSGTLDSAEYHDILHSLSGYYPLKYRVFEREYRRKEKEEKDNEE